MPLSKTGAELLFEVFSQRYERGSTLVTSNLPFDEWTEVFGSERLTGALLDRLTHHVHILEMNGESYRLNQSRNRQNRLPADPTPRPGLPPWVHRPLPRAPPRQPGEGHAAARAGPSRGLRGQTPSTEWSLFTPPPRSHIAPPLTILEYFTAATQIGMTATPKETRYVSNIDYFGAPVYSYSLKQGIHDGYLAPYKVVKVHIDRDVEGYRPEKGKLDREGVEVEDRIYNAKDLDRTLVLDDRTGRSLRPTGATEVAPARHAKAAERPHACAPPSIAGQVPVGLPAKPGLGKTWTSQARPHLPQAHQQQLSSQNYRSCSGPPWTLRLSQFCVQENRVRLTRQLRKRRGSA